MQSLGLLSLVVALSLMIKATAVTFYISPMGSDSNLGTSPASPWLTAAHASVHKFDSGDAVLFEAGVDHVFDIGLVVRSVPPFPSSYHRSLANPIVISSYGDSFSRARLLINATLSNGITVLSTAGVEVSNVDLQHIGGSKAIFHGVQFSSDIMTGDRIVGGGIWNVSVSGFVNGISIEADGCQGFQDIIIENVAATDSIGSGISIDGFYTSTCFSHSNILIRGCNADYNPGDSDVTNSWTGSGIVASAVDGIVIERCRASFNGFRNGHTPGGPYGIWFWNTNNGTIRHCVSHSNSNGQPPMTANDGGGFDLDGGCTNCLIEYSLSFNNTGAGYLVCSFGGPRPVINNTIRYSVSFGDGVATAPPSSLFTFTPDELLNTVVIGNTFISKNGEAVFGSGFGLPANGLVMEGNAFLSLAGGPIGLFEPDPPKNAIFSGNEYWSSEAGRWNITWGSGFSYTSLEDFRFGAGQEIDSSGAPTGSSQDPLLTTSDGFFKSCVEWEPGFPDIPNSPYLNKVRAFSGC